MKLNSKLLSLLFICCGLIVFFACDDDDDPEPCTEQTWYEDVDGDGLGNPNVSQMACEQPTGFVANADDDMDCVTTTFYEDNDGDGLGNPDVSQDACEQPEGFVDNADDDNDNPAPTISLFETEIESLTATPDDWETIFDGTNGRFENFATLNGDPNISAMAGNNYISFVVEDVTEGGEARFQLNLTDEGTPALDLTAFGNPHINFWLNSGADPNNIMAFDMDIRDSVLQAMRDNDGETISTLFTWEQDHGDAELDADLDNYQTLANRGVIDNNTAGEWRLYSIPFSDMNWIPDGSSTLGLVGIDNVRKVSRLRFNLALSSVPERTGNFVVHIDEISISDGPIN